MLNLFLPGVAITYYGEEIGMLNNMDIDFEQTVDPAGCNCGPENYNDYGCSRDVVRTPMQWDSSSESAGFTLSNEPWLPINVNYVDINVEDQKNDPGSHMSVYKAMAERRNGEGILKVGRNNKRRVLHLA